MSRVEMLREARSKAHVVFTEYMKIRNRGVPVLVFEGKQCPTFYLSKIALILNHRPLKQLIARNKRNVLELRNLIRKNIATANDAALFFVDKDYDISPKSGDFQDLYVTSGYSIENDCVYWGVIESYIRANFDIADASDEDAVIEIKNMYGSAWETYLQSSLELQKILFICRRSSIKCIPGDDFSTYFQVDWSSQSVSAIFNSLENLFEILQLSAENRTLLANEISKPGDFEILDPILEWRGKFHLSFIRSLLLHLASARIEGTRPFKRRARIAVDPGHPSLLSMIGAYAQAPECLVRFIRTALPTP